MREGVVRGVVEDDGEGMVVWMEGCGWLCEGNSGVR